MGPDAELDFAITLRDYEKEKESWQMKDDEKLAAAEVGSVRRKGGWEGREGRVLEAQKERGTAFFKAGKLKLAAAKYAKIVDLLQYMDSLQGYTISTFSRVWTPREDWVGEEKERKDGLLLAAHLNLALVYGKKGEAMEAVREADKALELAPGNVKALYRRATVSPASISTIIGSISFLGAGP